MEPLWEGQRVVTIMWMEEQVGLINREEYIMPFAELVEVINMVLPVHLEAGLQPTIAQTVTWQHLNLS